jgi:hypothetical protein
VERVEAKCDNPALKLSAYVGPNKRDLVVVLINPTNQAQRTTVTPDDVRFKARRSICTGPAKGNRANAGATWENTLRTVS